ncbi:asparaginase domain-containing protein [Mesorhizobium sp. J428]|uniref:asparaginase domain-containing protein n=1 Tax=Mesorhizobium sp. J428 TaxID=2898440 RepID=UPI00215193F7|nr:asparaginase domain-containing protein [Mesorhizobium sp. J428]MCR5856969.1 asparaginase domain-containing protein [Mesorhizobium sp. J428]
MALRPLYSNKKIRIAHLAGPNATIQNTPPLVTSNKAREAHGLPLLTDVEGMPSRFDPLRPQKLAVPVTVYVEQFSAHPLEKDVAELYAAPDGYVDAAGNFSPERTSDADKPVYRIELKPEDGYYPMPYMARQADGSAWETDGTGPRVERAKSRQPFMPDGRRTFDEVDRLGVDGMGLGNAISDVAEVDFYRLAPSAGYTKGLAAAERTDEGEGDIAPEVSGTDFFPYRPAHLNASPPRMSLARITNMAQDILGSGDYDGAIWTQGSPRVEETCYWLSLALDVTVPVCCNASQRYHGQISNDGPKNLADSTDWIASKVWADDQGRNRVGVVMVQDQRVFAAREVTKVDARPGGYVAAGGHGGILGAGGGGTGSVLRYVPAMKHTWQSEVNVSKLPASVTGIRGREGGIETIEVAVKDGDGRLLDTAIPKVSIVKDASYIEDDYDSDPAQEVDTIAFMEQAEERPAVRFRAGGPQSLRQGGCVVEVAHPVEGGLFRFPGRQCRARHHRRFRHLRRPVHRRLKPDLGQGAHPVDAVHHEVRHAAAGQRPAQADQGRGRRDGRETRALSGGVRYALTVQAD